jgi:hypothetical protein
MQRSYSKVVYSSKASLSCKELEGSLQCSKKLANGSCSEPLKFSPYSHALFIQDLFQYDPTILCNKINTEFMTLLRLAIRFSFQVCCNVISYIVHRVKSRHQLSVCKCLSFHVCIGISQQNVYFVPLLP